MLKIRHSHSLYYTRLPIFIHRTLLQLRDLLKESLHMKYISLALIAYCRLYQNIFYKCRLLR